MFESEFLESRSVSDLECDCENIEPTERDLRGSCILTAGTVRKDVGFAPHGVCFCVGRRLGRHLCFLPFDGCRSSANPFAGSAAVEV
jgi:hypothetical protein